MIRCFAFTLGLLAATPALASCRIAGDCIALGLGAALPGCTTDAAVGIPAAAVVARARGPAGGPAVDWLVVSAGSNDVPRGLPSAGYARARASIERSLDAIAAARGSARLVVILPANGARAIVAAWADGAAARGVAAVSFLPGADGIHPRSYRALGRAVLALMAAGS